MTHFKSFDGLRFIAFLPIFFLHACGGDMLYTITLASLDFFFLLSGFLTAYGRLPDFTATVPNEQKKMAIWSYTMRYMSSKIRTFYPIHLGCFFWCLLIILCFSPQSAGFVPSSPTEWAWKTPLHLLLLQSWSCEPDIKFCFNGVTWFLSSLMFCYAVSPLLLMQVSRLYSRYGKKCFFLIGITALLLKTLPYIYNADLSISTDFTSLYDRDIHSWPLLRLLDYSIGMCAGCLLRLHPPSKTPSSFFQYTALLLLSVSCIFTPGPVTLLLSVILLYLLATCSTQFTKLLSCNIFVFLGGLVMPLAHDERSVRNFFRYGIDF